MLDGKRNSLDERISRMLSLSKVNEAKISLVDGLDEDDDIPNDIWSGPQPVTNTDSSLFEAGEEEEQPEAGAEEAPVEEPVEEPAPEEFPAEEPELEPTPEPVPEKSTDEIQNDIIKLNISAMQKMQGVIDNIDNSIDALNQKVTELSGDVEEVREPTSVEKLESRKDDSHPYYYNLNDMWQGNAFQARADQTGEQGIRKLDDGSYVADFDDLPKHTEQQIKDSLNKY